MALKLRRKRKLGLLAALLAVMALAACDTQPATDVRGDAATLNAKGACVAGTSGNWWYQLRNASTGSGWSDVGPAHGYSCGQNTGEVALTPYRVGNLTPGHLYQFRLRATVNGPSYTYDSTGAQGGTNYDSFRTPGFSNREDQNAPPGDEAVPCTPDSPDDACASSDNIRRKKNPLRNRFFWVFCEGCLFLEMDVSDHRSYLDWSYNLSTRNIRWINKTHETNCLSNIGYCAEKAKYWRLAECNRSGPDTCLFRSEGRVEVNFVIKNVGWNRQLISCLGTRINWDGSHTRNAWEGECSTFGTARARSADVSDQELKIGDVPVGDYLTRGDMRALDRACISKKADKGECKRVALNLYRGLPDTVRSKVEGKKVSHVLACPALSREALDSLSPDTRCARRP